MKTHAYRFILALFVTTVSFAALSEGIGKYSVNLLCINQDKNEALPVICREDLFSHIADSAKKWAKLNPEAVVTFWYDGNLASAKAIEESKKRMQDKTLPNLQFQDIKSIAFVADNPDAFSSYAPLYFRIDFLKLVIVANEIINRNLTSAVFADAEVKQMNKAQLFSSEIMKVLPTQGLITNANNIARGHTGSGALVSAESGENQFIQAFNSESTKSALRHTINVNLLRVMTGLNLDNGEMRITVLQKIYNACFFSTSNADFVGGFAAKHRSRQIQINTKALGGEDKWVEYSERQHGYLPFGNAISTSGGPIVISGTSVLGSAREFVQYDGKTSDDRVYTRKDIGIRGGNAHTDVVKPKPEGKVFKYKFWM